MLIEMSKFTGRESCPSEETLARTVSTAVMLKRRVGDVADPFDVAVRRDFEDFLR